MATTSFQPTAMCTISYKGDVEPEVEQIKTELEGGGLVVAPPQAIPDPKKSLGASHIVLEFVLSPAAKAIVTVVFTKLMNYLLDRMNHQKDGGKNSEETKPSEKTINLRIVLRNEAQEVVGRELLALKEADADAVRRSVERLSQTASQYYDA